MTRYPGASILGAVMALTMFATGCQAGGSGSGPTPTGASGVEGLVADLQRAGATVTVGASFSTEPLSGQGVQVCVNGEPVRVYVFATPEARAELARRIDPSDPSKVGTVMVEWMGSPRFWQRDRIIVLYLGGRAATELMLTSVLGQPFASGQGLPPQNPERCA